jgi:hypothetical protein
LGQGKRLSPRAKKRFEKLSNFLGFRIQRILIKFTQRFQSFLDIKIGIRNKWICKLKSNFETKGSLKIKRRSFKFLLKFWFWFQVGLHFGEIASSWLWCAPEEEEGENRALAWAGPAGKSGQGKRISGPQERKGKRKKKGKMKWNKKERK